MTTKRTERASPEPASAAPQAPESEVNHVAHRYPAVAYSITIRISYTNRIGMLNKITGVIAKIGGDMGSIDIVESSRERITRDLTVNARDVAHGQEVVKILRKTPSVQVISVSDDTFRMHLGG